MSKQFDNVVTKIEEAKKNNENFIIYPFGERGAMVKGILNHIFNIKELAVADNNLSKIYDNIISLASVAEILEKNPSATVLLAHDNPATYQNVRKNLYEYINRECCVDIFDCPPLLDKDVQTHEREKYALEKKKAIGFDDKLCIYHPKRTHSNFYLPLYKIDLIQNEIFLSDDYNSRVQLDRVFKLSNEGLIGTEASGRLFLDIGANIGNHTLYFANELNASMVHSFEPVPQTFSILKKNVEINNLKNTVHLHNCGLGIESSKTSIISYDKRNIGGTSLWPDENGEIEIKRLDDFVFDENIYFIKMDVEGMELAVLQGGAETIKKHRPYILLEAWFEKINPIREFMNEINYIGQQITEVDYLFFYQG